MKHAVLTGVTSGIGYELADYLLKETDYHLYGISRRVDDNLFSSTRFTALPCDLTDTRQLHDTAERVLYDSGKSIDLLINNAGWARFAPHEEQQPEHIASMVDLNLRAPLLLTNALLRSIKARQGVVINISSITGQQNSPWGGTYAATKAGLRHFGSNLFDEVRKSGVKVVSLLPDIVDTPFYEQMPFEPEPDPDTHLTPSQIRDSVRFILEQGQQMVVSEMHLRPQKLQIRKKKRR